MRNVAFYMSWTVPMGWISCVKRQINSHPVKSISARSRGRYHSKLISFLHFVHLRILLTLALWYFLWTFKTILDVKSIVVVRTVRSVGLFNFSFPWKVIIKLDGIQMSECKRKWSSNKVHFTFVIKPSVV